MESVASASSINRPLANFHPNVWGNTFLLQNINEQTNYGEEERIEELKEEVRRELKQLTKNGGYMGQIGMVDSIQRLGIAYHFEPEIETILQNVFENFDDFCKSNKDDMYGTALCFRLLRQQGHKVSCRTEIFEKFLTKDEKEELKVDNNVMGMLEFYEAAHMRIHGEDILEKGLDYATNYLELALPYLTNPIIAEQVDHALNGYSNRRGLPRLEARFYIPIYAQLPHYNQTLLTLAKLDFNLLQSLHKKELNEIYKWWKGLDVETTLPYIRDRIVETYFWILGVYFEPQYGVARKILSKVQAIASILDDTYDAYATFEELQVFTEAILRWDISSLDQLPEYMQVIYKALLELFAEIEEEQVMKQGGSYRIAYGREAVKELARNYFEESKWREEKYIPTMEEYMKLATKSCGYTSLIITSFLGIHQDIATRESFDWVLSQPDMIKATLIICRLTDDMVGHEFEKERNHIPSAVECYMKEYSLPEEAATLKFNIEIEEAWKDLNEGFLRPTEIPIPLLYCILNFARIIEVMYKKGDWYTHVGPEMQNYISQLLIHPLPQ